MPDASRRVAPAAAFPDARAPDDAARPIRVMIVDDSVVARAILSRVVAADDDFEVVAQAQSADAALRMLETTSVDIITLDVEMPGTDGLTALPELLRQGRGARVLVVSSIAEDGAAATVRALALGAADTLPKPGGGRPHGNFAQTLISKMRAIGRARVGGEPALRSRPDLGLGTLPLRTVPAVPIRCVAVGASTGGLHALGQLFAGMPDALGVPILVTQHLPAVFVPFFARQLAALTGRDAAVAADGDELAPDRILVAPGDGHLGLRLTGRGIAVAIDRRGPVGGCLPAVDPMFDAVAEQYGLHGCGVVLTGMGRDGLGGSAKLAAAGAAVMVQDPDSSAVWGMPRSVAEAGHACAVLDPLSIGRRIAIRARGSAVGASTWK